MKNRLVIVGAGGHGKVVADLALKNGYTELCFVDDYAAGDCMGFPIIGVCGDLSDLHDGRTDFVIAIGNNAAREKVAEAYDVNWVTLVHPSAQIAVNVTLGTGTVVMAGAVINACAKVGKHCIINSCAVVEHDNVLEDYVHISPNAALGGTVRIGGLSHVGLGAIVRNNVEVSDCCVIGAGAVVVEDIAACGTYVGIPARKIR